MNPYIRATSSSYKMCFRLTSDWHEIVIKKLTRSPVSPMAATICYTYLALSAIRISFSSYFAMVEGLRRAPDSYCDIKYYSQIPYKFIPKVSNQW